MCRHEGGFKTRNKTKICHKKHLEAEDATTGKPLLLFLESVYFIAAAMSFTAPASLYQLQEKSIQLGLWILGPLPKCRQEKAIYLSFLASVVVGLAFHQDS